MPDDIATAWNSDKPLPERGIKILGTPFGTTQYISTYWGKLSSERAQLLNLIPKLPSRQAAWLLLYFCAVPRMNHILRTVPLPEAQPMAEAHDRSIIEVFRNVFQLPQDTEWNTDLHGMEYTAWVDQARLPLRLAGMGLRDSQRASSVAYWAS